MTPKRRQRGESSVYKREGEKPVTDWGEFTRETAAHRRWQGSRVARLYLDYGVPFEEAVAMVEPAIFPENRP